jgi:hypothetical protein
MHACTSCFTASAIAMHSLAMKPLIVIATLLIIHGASSESPLEVVSNFKLLKQVNQTFHEVDHELNIMPIMRREMQQVKSQQMFLIVNNEYRHLLDRVINFNGTASLSKIENWIYYYRPPSMTLNDIKIQIRRAVDYLTPFQSKVTSINQQRSNALALPFDQKVKVVEQNMGQLIELLPVRDQINEQLESAIFDFRTFLKDDE